MKSVGEGRLRYLGQSGADTEYYNIARDLSFVNARNEEITDRQGNLYGYWCKVETTSAANDLLVISYIPNTWKVRNAFRKFHFAREQMFRDAGITKKEMGKYGRTLRPYFSADHVTKGSLEPQKWDVNTQAGRSYTGGEWTYTTLASSPTVTSEENMSDTDIPPVDEWAITVLGGHVQEAISSDGVKSWTSVGMVHAYNQDRMEEIPDATTESSVVALNNPLSSLQTQTLISGEVLEIATDQQLETPPYDIDDNGDSAQAIYDVMPVAGTTAGATAALRNWGLYFFPAGLITLTHTTANSSGLEIEVVGKQLCKDVA